MEVSEKLWWEVTHRSWNLRCDVGKVEKMRRFSVQLPDHVAGWVGVAAGRKRKPPGSFLKEIITQTAEEDIEPLESRLGRLNGLIGAISVLAREVYARREEI